MTKRMHNRRRYAVAALARCLTLLGCFAPAAFGQAERRHVEGDYRHRHRAQAVALSDGAADVAARESDHILAKYPDDAEALYFRALAAAHQGEHQAATSWIDEARQAGLPAERLLLGPRRWSEPIWQSDAYQTLRSSLLEKLAHGPMLGAPRPDGIDVWLRTFQPARVELLVRRIAPGSAEPAISHSAETTADTDHTAVVSARGLQPNQTYVYNVRIGDQWHFGEPWPRFQTAPYPGQATRLRFAFGGGAAYTPRFETMWQVIAARQPQCLLLLGDNVYIDDPENRDYQRYLYYRRQSQPDFRQLVARTSVLAIWDDHDFGTNDCFGGPLVEQPVWKRQVWEVFRQNWVNPAYGGGTTQPGCWFDWTYGDIQFFFLDGRYYRTPNPDDGTTPTMLGPAQLAWLKERLRQSRARVKFLVSPVPWIGGNQDKWTGFAAERSALWQFLDDHRIDGVYLLSADRHRSDLLVTRRPGRDDLYEFMSSKLTNHHTHAEIDEREGALFSYNDQCSFGLVTVDTRADQPLIRYEIWGIDGQRVFATPIGFDARRSSQR